MIQSNCREEMDSLATEYSKLAASSITQQYAFIPAHPKPIAYISSTFLHGGWLHLIGNMWFLWLAGFVLEDVWGRPLYLIFYFVAGIAVATQLDGWANPGSIVPTLGASGAIAGLMGAFLGALPKIEDQVDVVLWLLAIRFLAASGCEPTGYCHYGWEWRFITERCPDKVTALRIGRMSAGSHLALLLLSPCVTRAWNTKRTRRSKKKSLGRPIPKSVRPAT